MRKVKVTKIKPEGRTYYVIYKAPFMIAEQQAVKGKNILSAFATIRRLFGQDVEIDQKRSAPVK